jgi:hypothetical protein
MKLILDSNDVRIALEYYIGTMGIDTAGMSVSVAVFNGGKELKNLSATVEVVGASIKVCKEEQLDLPLEDPVAVPVEVVADVAVDVAVEEEVPSFMSAEATLEVSDDVIDTPAFLADEPADSDQMFQ